MRQVKPGGLVFIGAAFGALARALIDEAVAGDLGGINTSTIIVNLLGAFLMGLLVATWTRKRGMKPLWDNIKIFAGTGFLGAFTTYSTFALAMASAASQARPSALAVGVGTVATGVLGAWLGILLGSRSKPAIDEGGEHL